MRQSALRRGLVQEDERLQALRRIGAVAPGVGMGRPRGLEIRESVRDTPAAQNRHRPQVMSHRQADRRPAFATQLDHRGQHRFG